MGKILVLAEKPSVAKDIAGVVGANVRKEGFLEGDKYVVTYAIGHLVGLVLPEEYDPSYKKWDWATLPIVPKKFMYRVIDDRGTKKQFDVISSLVARSDVDEVVIATDAGREGELIAHYILEMAKCAKPRKRLWLSSMTAKAIKEGFANLLPAEAKRPLCEAAQCRDKGDWLVGINMTRALALRTNDSKVSIGRVVTPTTAILTKRELEIRGFKPQDYWEIVGTFGGAKGKWFKGQRSATRIGKGEIAEFIAEKVMDMGTAEVKELKKENKSQPHPTAYDLTTLQSEANAKFGFDLQTTLDIAQALYEKHKLTTYPRTDSSFLSDDIVGTLDERVTRVGEAPEYGKFAQDITTRGGAAAIVTRPGGFDRRVVDNTKVTDHHAIIPTEMSPRNAQLTDSERKVYDLIVRRFLGLFYPDHEYEQTTVTLDAAEETFALGGRKVTAPGWKAVYDDKSPDDEKDETAQALPDMAVGDELEVNSCESLKRQTQPPKAYTAGTLVKAMEHCGREVEDEEKARALKARGLGTVATRASIVDKVLAKGYAEKKGKTLRATDRGIELIRLLPAEISSPELTGEWEMRLAEIEGGKNTPSDFMDGLEAFVRDGVEKVRAIADISAYQKASPSARNDEPLGKCPICGSDVKQYPKSFSCSAYKDTGCKFAMWKEQSYLFKYGKTLDRDMAERVLRGEQVEVKGLYSKEKKKKFDVVMTLGGPEGKYPYSLQFAFPQREGGAGGGSAAPVAKDAVGLKCPKCGGPMWDNRADKRTGKRSSKSPDFSCKDRDGCKEAIWDYEKFKKEQAKAAGEGAGEEPQGSGDDAA